MPNKNPLAAKRALVVDDETMVRELISEILSDEGMEVDGAADGRAALELFARRPYDLITLDLAMPGLNGVGLHRALSETYGFGRRTSALLPPRLPPILLVTGWSHSPEVLDLLLGERIAGVLQKPLRLDDLVRIAGEILAYEELRRERRAQALERLAARQAVGA